MAGIISGYVVEWSEWSATEPEDSGGKWKTLDDCIRKAPNFFPDPEPVDTTCITHTSKHNIPGMTGGEAYAFTVAVDKQFLDAHAKMVEEQNDEEKGSFWLRIKMVNRGECVVGRFTTVNYLPTPENEAGALDEITWNVYADSDLTVKPITAAAALKAEAPKK